MRYALLSLLSVTSTAAFAGPPQPVEHFEGTYDLACEDASMSMHVGVTGVIDGAPGSWEKVFDLPIGCSLVQEQASQVQREIFAACRSMGGEGLDCGYLINGVTRSAVELSNALMPTEMDLNVNEPDGLGWLLGLHAAPSTHTWSNGTQQSWTYLLKNDGPNRGSLSALGMTVVDAKVEGRFDCSVLGIGDIDGQLASQYDLSAHYTVDGAFHCASDLGDGDWLAADIAIGIDARGTGTRRR